MNKLIATVLALSAVLAACSTTPAPGVARVRSNARFPVGVSLGDHLMGMSKAQVERELDSVVRLHAPWIRIDVSWADVQPASAASFSWDGLDRIVHAAAQRGLHVLAVIGYTPAWARAPGCEIFSCPPADLTRFAAFAAAVASRYKTSGLSHYEIWNEPNLNLFWNHPDPVAYRNLLVQAVAAIRRVQPRAFILFGGLSALSTGTASIGGATFLAEACATHQCDVDAFADHPYTFPRLPADGPSSHATAWTAMTSTTVGGSIPAVLKSVAPGTSTIWVTEFGAPTSGADADDHVSAARQAEIVAAGLRAAEDDRRIGAYFVYTLNDLNSYGTNEDHFGLLTLSGRPKPAYDVLRRSLAPSKVHPRRSGG